MIPQQYINEGVRIRQIYMENLREILKLEDSIIKEKNNLEKVKKEAELIVKDPDISEARKKLTLNQKLYEMDKNIRTIQNTIKPFYDKIEKLREDADRLLIAIKEKYPNISPQEIEKDIMSHVRE